MTEGDDSGQIQRGWREISRYTGRTADEILDGIESGELRASMKRDRMTATRDALEAWLLDRRIRSLVLAELREQGVHFVPDTQEPVTARGMVA